MKKWVLLVLILLMMLTLTVPTMAQTGEAEAAQSAASTAYTVEFTYDNKQYVLPGDSEVALSEVLGTVGLTGEVSTVEVSDESLFSAKKCKTASDGKAPERDKDGKWVEDESGTWFIFAHQAFSTEEWMKFTIGGVAYEIVVTDAQGNYDISNGFITINSGNVGSWNGRTITGTVNKVGNSFPQGASDGATYYRSAICIDGVTVNLTIRDLSIVAIFDNSVGAYKVSPILLLNGATLNLTLEGNNTLTACVGGAGICVPDGCGLNIDGSGSLVAKGGDGGASEQQYDCLGGAAIGAEDKPDGSELSRTGSIYINGGTINATGGAAFSNRGGSAGIGGSGYVDGDVIINGGNVTAKGGDYAAGIGGGIAAGGVITINGGTVKAIANTAGSAIGSGAGTDISTIAINGGSVTADGNIGSPDTASGKSTLTVDFSRAVIACEGNGRVNCRNAAIQTFTITVYDAALTQGNHACTFWVNEKNTRSAAMPATLSVSEAGVGTATVKGLVCYGDTYSMQVTGHLQIGAATYDTTAVQMSADTTSMSLYSGYRITLTGTVYDAAIAPGQTGTVSVEGVTLASQSVSTLARKATVSAVFYYKEGAVDDEDLTKNVSVTVGGKTYAVGDVTFAKSATHQKKGSFIVSEGGIDYVKLDGEVAFVSPYNVIESETTIWTGDKNNGFYAATAGQSVTINDVVTVSGNVNLVLTDGSTLTAAKGIDMGESSSLTIWQQSEGTGKLVAVARTDAHVPGIGSTIVNNSSITINGGTVEATGHDCPGIGGDTSDNLNITINAGKVTAKGSSSGGGGIGSKSGTITINGGTVVATASESGYAGIWSESGSIAINGGHVTATGTGDGAAIGGGAAGDTGSIAISGGTVVANAVSDASAAAIGGGNGGSFTSITISGGNVTANGGNYAAAIGGGVRSTGGSATIDITGGTVRANGGSFGAGIGNGFGGKCTITTTLSYDNASSGMSVYASSYRFENDDTTNTVKLLKAFKDAGSGTGFAATDSADLAAIARKTLVPSESYGVTVDNAIEHGTVTASPSRAVKDAVITLTVEPDTENGYKLKPGSLKATYAGGEASLTQDGSDPTKYTFTMPAADVTVTAVFTNHEHDFTYTANGATITATCANSDNNCDLTNHQAMLTVNAPTGSVTYDGTEKAATVTGEIPGVTTPEIAYTKEGDASFTGTPVNAGTYTASITLEGAIASVKYTIAKAAINPTLVIQNKTYDGKEITYTIENNPGNGGVTGFSWEKKNSDESWSTVSDTPKDAGTYRGTVTIAETENYQGATTNTVEFTIRKVSLAVTAKANTITYGDTPADGGVEYSGFVNNETEDVLGGTLAYDYSYAQYGDVGNSYTITPKGLTSDNYEITFNTGMLTVGQKEVGLTWSSTSLTYSGTAQAPTAEATGLVNSDTISVTVSGAQTNPGTGYTATASSLTGEKAGNYKLPSANSTTFTIGKASLTVRAKPKTITYGDEPTNDGVTYTGFVNNDNSTVLVGTLDYDYSYTQYGDAGSYAITPKGVTAANYEISFVAGTLTVGQKEIGLTWSSTPLTFNGSAQAPTAAATGMVNGDEINVTVSDGQTDAGTGYTATASGLTGDKAGNYKLPDTKTTTFAINKAAAQTLEDVSVSQVYTLTDVSASVAGKMPEDAGTLTYAKGTESKTGNVTVSSWDVDSSGTVTAMISGGAAGDTVTLPVIISSTNYADSTVNVVVTLREKDDVGVSITGIPPMEIEYGDTLTLTGSVQNPGTNGTWTWENSDSTVFGITGNGAEAVIDALNAGSATITASYVSDTSVGTFTTESITVHPRAITITANNKNIYVGDVIPALDDYKVEWLLNQDALTTAPTLVYQKNGEEVTPDNTTSGTYDIVPSSASAGKNYSISYTKGTLTISEKQPATVTKVPTAKALTYNGQAQDLVEAGSATGGIMQYAIGTASEATEPYTTSIPAKTDAGTYYVWYKAAGKDNYADSLPSCVICRINEKGTFTVRFDANGGTGTMEPQTFSEGEQFVFPTCTFIAPAGKMFAHWKAGDRSYPENDTITVKSDLTAVAVWTDDKEMKGTRQETLKEVPAELKSLYDTVQQIETALLEKLMINGQTPVRGQTLFIDVELMISRDGGKTWVKATAEDFREGGITVEVDYPEGTNGREYLFAVAHMLTIDMNGRKAGEIEIPKVETTEKGLRFTLNGLSPVAISWQKLDDVAGASLPNTGDGSNPIRYMTMLLIALAGIGLIVRKRK